MEWKLKDLTVDGKGSYGIGAPAVPYQEDKLTYLRITDINDDGSLNFSDLKSVDAEDAEKYILKENDIVLQGRAIALAAAIFMRSNMVRLCMLDS